MPAVTWTGNVYHKLLTVAGDWTGGIRINY